MYKPYVVVCSYGVCRDAKGRVMFFATEKAAEELAELLTLSSLNGETYTVTIRRRQGGK